MNWFKKIARGFDQLPFNDPTEGKEDYYDPKNPDYPYKKKKIDALEDSPGLGTNVHSNDEVSGTGGNASPVDSLTSGHKIDNQVYNGEIMDEDPAGGRPAPRTDRSNAVEEQFSTLGIVTEPNPLGASEDTGDKTPQEVAMQNNSHRKVKLNNVFVNIPN